MCKILSEVKSVENTIKTAQNFLEISSVKKEVLPLCKLTRMHMTIRIFPN